MLKFCNIFVTIAFCGYDFLFFREVVASLQKQQFDNLVKACV